MRIALLCRFAVPVRCFAVVLRYTATVLVHRTQPVLNLAVSLFRDFSIPNCSFGVILWKRVAHVVRVSQGQLGFWIALFGRFPQPFCRLGNIDLAAVPPEERQRENLLGPDVSSLRLLPQSRDVLLL